jgi:Zn-finger nucleic acid-binding protein
MSHPAPIPLDALPCPACGNTLTDDPDGTRCPSCDGVLVHRTWATRAQPELGRPALSPVFIGDARARVCSLCQREMGAVQCHGVLAWSCARCRFLFFDGPKHRALTTPHALPSPRLISSRTLHAPSLLRVVANRAQQAPSHVRDALGIMVLAALVVVAMILEVRPS